MLNVAKVGVFGLVIYTIQFFILLTAFVIAGLPIAIFIFLPFIFLIPIILIASVVFYFNIFTEVEWIKTYNLSTANQSLQSASNQKITVKTIRNTIFFSLILLAISLSIFLFNWNLIPLLLLQVNIQNQFFTLPLQKLLIFLPILLPPMILPITFPWLILLIPIKNIEHISFSDAVKASVLRTKGRVLQIWTQSIGLLVLPVLCIIGIASINVFIWRVPTPESLLCNFLRQPIEDNFFFKGPCRASEDISGKERDRLDKEKKTANSLRHLDPLLWMFLWSFFFFLPITHLYQFLLYEKLTKEKEKIVSSTEIEAQEPLNSENNLTL